MTKIDLAPNAIPSQEHVLQVYPLKRLKSNLTQ
jgi:hypothetical protein